MTLTLLLDLDDTLLSNDIDTFLPAYLKALGKHLIKYVAPDQMVQHLLAGTRNMIENNDPGLTLEQAFDQIFYPAIGHTKESMRGILEEFYEKIFPELQPLTALLPEAVRLVEWAAAHGHTLVVATNPIFPRRAILHRLQWAGLDPEKVPFALITDYEKFHFAKPNPAFFAEILAQLGWPNQPAVVIGNSLADDLTPAAQLGLPVFWVGQPTGAIPEGYPAFSESGQLSDIPAWIERIDEADLRQTFKEPRAIIPVIKATPAAFDTFQKGLHPRQWQERPAPEEWSLTEIYCHLQDVDLEVNIPRVDKLITEPVPFLAGINTDSWAEERDYARNDGPAALNGFIAARTRLVKKLENLAPEEWERMARHAIFGPTQLKELVGFITTHDRSHMQQVYAAARVLGDEQSKNHQSL